MECGICALVGVILGAVITKGITITLPKKQTKQEKKVEKETAEKLGSMAEQWNNLLSYDGGKKQ